MTKTTHLKNILNIACCWKEEWRLYDILKQTAQWLNLKKNVFEAYLKLLCDVLIGKTLEATRSKESWEGSWPLKSSRLCFCVSVCMCVRPACLGGKNKTKNNNRVKYHNFTNFCSAITESEVCRQKRRVVWVSQSCRKAALCKLLKL